MNDHDRHALICKVVQEHDTEFKVEIYCDTCGCVVDEYECCKLECELQSVGNTQVVVE
jgi:hypothetical protein